MTDAGLSTGFIPFAPQYRASGVLLQLDYDQFCRAGALVGRLRFVPSAQSQVRRRLLPRLAGGISPP